MQKVPRIGKKIVIYLPALLVTLAAGLLLNAYYQASRHYESLLPRSQIAVFINKSVQASHQLIGEKLMNIEGVSGVTYVSQDKVLETAMKDAPALKELFVTGDNPFSPYFIVEPKEKTSAMAGWIKAQMSAVEGIEDIRFDPNIFGSIDQLGTLKQFYGGAVRLLFAITFLLALLKFVMHWMHRLVDYRHLLRQLAVGASAGVFGALVYYLPCRYMIASPVVQMPGHLYAAMVFAGILASFAGEN